MERTQTHEVGAAFFELHIAAHDFNDVSSRDEFLYESLRNGHGRYCGSGLDSLSNAFTTRVCLTRPDKWVPKETFNSLQEARPTLDQRRTVLSREIWLSCVEISLSRGKANGTV